MFKTIEEVEHFFNERTIEGIKVGLSRMEELLTYAGNPERKTKFIHVAGTNGKGSTIEYIKAGLRNANRDVGIFSSPSLEGLLGHIRINDTRMKESDFIEILNDLYPKIKEMDRLGNNPTEFEIITTIAFIYFSQKVSLAIIETGMGGRGDTTNCIRPLLSVLTNVSIDHKAFLGNTTSSIAKEKAGIIKEKVAVISGESSRAVLDIFKEKAQRMNSPIITRGEDFSVENETIEEDYTSFDLLYKKERYRIKIRAKGIYQIQNSSLAAIVLIELNKIEPFSHSIKEVFKGFSKVDLPGRFEVISRNPQVIVDGAHNVAAVRFLVKTINSQLKEGDKTLIFSAFSDKEFEEMLSILTPHFNQTILTSFNHPRACTLEELTSFVKRAEAKVKVQELGDIVSSIRNNPDKPSYIFTGSLYFVKNVKNLFQLD